MRPHLKLVCMFVTSQGVKRFPRWFKKKLEGLIWLQITSCLVMWRVSWLDHPKMPSLSLSLRRLCMLSHWEQEVFIIQAGHMIFLLNLWGAPISVSCFLYNSLRWVRWCGYTNNRFVKYDIVTNSGSKLSIRRLWGYWFTISHHIEGTAVARIDRPIYPREI